MKIAHHILQPYILVPLNEAHADAAELQFNANMSGVHVGIELSYGDLRQK